MPCPYTTAAEITLNDPFCGRFVTSLTLTEKLYVFYAIYAYRMQQQQRRLTRRCIDGWCFEMDNTTKHIFG